MGISVTAEPEGSDTEQPQVELGELLEHRGRKKDVEFETMDESLGTLVWLGLIGPVVESLSRGSVLLADELESSLHPTLVIHLARLLPSTPAPAQS